MVDSWLSFQKKKQSCFSGKWHLLPEETIILISHFLLNHDLRRMCMILLKRSICLYITLYTQHLAPTVSSLQVMGFGGVVFVVHCLKLRPDGTFKPQTWNWMRFCNGIVYKICPEVVMSPIFSLSFWPFFSSEVMTSAQNAMRRKLCDSWVMTNNMYQVSNIGDIAIGSSSVSCDLQGKMGIFFFTATIDYWRPLETNPLKTTTRGPSRQGVFGFWLQKNCWKVATLEETTLHAANPTENQYSSLRWWIWFLSLICNLGVRKENTSSCPSQQRVARVAD